MAAIKDKLNSLPKPSYELPYAPPAKVNKQEGEIFAVERFLSGLDVQYVLIINGMTVCGLNAAKLISGVKIENREPVERARSKSFELTHLPGGWIEHSFQPRDNPVYRPVRQPFYRPDLKDTTRHLPPRELKSESIELRDPRTKIKFVPTKDSFLDMMRKGHSLADMSIVRISGHRRKYQVVKYENVKFRSVTLPAVNSRHDKNSPYVTAEFSATKASTQTQTGIWSQVVPISKKWSSENFRLDIRGFNDITGHISSVDPLVRKRGEENFHGITDYLETSSVSLPSMSFYLPARHGGPFLEWHEASRGGAAANLRSGTLEYLSSDMRSRIMGISLIDMYPADISRADDLFRVEMRAKSILPL